MKKKVLAIAMILAVPMVIGAGYFTYKNSPSIQIAKTVKEDFNNHTADNNISANIDEVKVLSYKKLSSKDSLYIVSNGYKILCDESLEKIAGINDKMELQVDLQLIYATKAGTKKITYLLGEYNAEKKIIDSLFKDWTSIVDVLEANTTDSTNHIGYQAKLEIKGTNNGKEEKAIIPRYIVNREFKKMMN